MREKLVPLVSAAVVVLLQIVVAPVIAIYSVVPSFIVAFVIVLSIVRPEDTTYVYAFVMGIISDLFTQVPFGLTPLLLLIISFALSRVFEVLDKSSIAMVLVSCAVSLLFYEMIVVIVQLVLGYPAAFFDLIAARALPATIFNLFCVFFSIWWRANSLMFRRAMKRGRWIKNNVSAKGYVLCSPLSLSLSYRSFLSLLRSWCSSAGVRPLRMCACATRWACAPFLQWVFQRKLQRSMAQASATLPILRRALPHRVQLMLSAIVSLRSGSSLRLLSARLL